MMVSFVIRRLLYAVVTFLGITIAVFVLVHSVPGDPISFYLGEAGGRGISKAVTQQIRSAHHLDEPLARQYVYWLQSVVRLDFGRSSTDSRRVIDRIAERLPKTLFLNLIAMGLALFLAIPLGVISAIRRGSRVDRGSAAILLLLYSLPAFWVALVLTDIFSVRLGILPLYGEVSDAYSALGFPARVRDRALHAILPVISLAYVQLAIFARFTRMSLLEVSERDFITTARAKGATELAVVTRHALRNALLPMITLLGLAVPSLVSGSVIIERMFQWEGIGSLYFEAVLARDYPTIMGLAMLTAVVTLLTLLICDFLYAWADPRIRIGERS